MAEVPKKETRFDQIAKGKLVLAGGTFNPILDIRKTVGSFVVCEWNGMREGGGAYNSKVHTVRVQEGDMIVKGSKDGKEPDRPVKAGEVVDFFGTTILDRTFEAVAAGTVVAIRYQGKRANKAGRHAGAESHIHEVVVVERPRE